MNAKMQETMIFKYKCFSVVATLVPFVSVTCQPSSLISCLLFMYDNRKAISRRRSLYKENACAPVHYKMTMGRSKASHKSFWRKPVDFLNQFNHWLHVFFFLIFSTSVFFIATSNFRDKIRIGHTESFFLKFSLWFVSLNRTRKLFSSYSFFILKKHFVPTDIFLESLLIHYSYFDIFFNSFILCIIDVKCLNLGHGKVLLEQFNLSERNDELFHYAMISSLNEKLMFQVFSIFLNLIIFLLIFTIILASDNIFSFFIFKKIDSVGILLILSLNLSLLLVFNYLYFSI